MSDELPRRDGRPRVLVIGGGFAGLSVARELSKSDAQVVILDMNNYHLFQPLLYQVATGGLAPGDIAEPIRFAVSKQRNVSVRIGKVVGVDLAKQRVQLADHAELDYDALVIAAGASSDYFGNGEWQQYAPSLKTIHDALDMRTRILGAFEKAEWETDPEEQRRLLHFVVIGGGPTGVELAGAIAEIAFGTLRKEYRNVDPRIAEIHLIEMGSALLAGYPEDLQASAKRQLEDLGVRVRLEERVESIDDDGLVVSGERIRAETVLWAAGVRAVGLTETLDDVEVDRKGRIKVGRDLTIPGHSNVFAIGDLAAFEEDGEVLPGIAPVAIQMGQYVGKLLRDEVRNGKLVAGETASPSNRQHAETRAASDSRSAGETGKVSESRKPFSYWDKGTMATIGRNRAVAQTGRFKFSGRLAWLAWAFVHLFFLIGARNRLVVFISWVWTYVTWQRGSRLVYRCNDP